jgi:hypothetical protein
MNTPAHAVINLLLLSRIPGHKPDHRRSAAIVFGALLPDLAIMVFYAWRFASPVSYWDPAHYGRWASLLEFTAVFAAAAFMFRRHVVLRPWVTVLAAIYLLYWIYVLLVWA